MLQALLEVPRLFFGTHRGRLIPVAVSLELHHHSLGFIVQSLPVNPEEGFVLFNTLTNRIIGLSEVAASFFNVS